MFDIVVVFFLFYLCGALSVNSHLIHLISFSCMFVRFGVRPDFIHSNCIRYALHPRTPKVRARNWGRRRGRQMCVEKAMANGREDECLHFQKSLEFS